MRDNRIVTSLISSRDALRGPPRSADVSRCEQLGNKILVSVCTIEQPTEPPASSPRRIHGSLRALLNLTRVNASHSRASVGLCLPQICTYELGGAASLIQIQASRLVSEHFMENGSKHLMDTQILSDSTSAHKSRCKVHCELPFEVAIDTNESARQRAVVAEFGRLPKLANLETSHPPALLSRLPSH